MSKMQMNILTSPAFLVAVFTLLANDLILKSHFHNGLTGKLSDFAGLFIFPLFWCAFLHGYRKAIYALTALSFVFWKSTYAQPLIDAWNSLSILPVSRVVDVTDLIALSVLPLSYFYSGRERPEASYRFTPHIIAVISLFAFTATSYSTELDYDNKFYFPDSKIELTRKLHHLADLNQQYLIYPCAPASSGPAIIAMEIPSTFCFDHVKAVVEISEEQGKSVVTLKKMGHRCPEGRNDKQELLPIFEKELIAKLTQISLGPPTIGTTNTAVPSARPRPGAAGQLYFVPIGELPKTDVEGLAGYFRKKYGIAIKVLPAISPGNNAHLSSSPSGSPLAGGLVELMKQENPKIASNPKSIMIGITRYMRVPESNRRYDFSYQSEERFAVIGAEGMDPVLFCEPENPDLLVSRLRKVMAKNIGILYYQLGRSENPGSVLYSDPGCVHELDNMGEDF